MIIIPAIDIVDGRCVRLRQGRADDMKVYSEDPVAMARRWADEGAVFLHVVDLDGAFKGRPVHTGLIARIAAAVDIPVEAGGGLRTEDDIEALLESGVKRVILGTRICEKPDELAGLVARFGSSLAVGLDARDGRVRVKGWTKAAKIGAEELASQVAAAGVRTLIYTDTAVDGMMTGPNVEAVESICKAVSCDVIASGGIASADDVKALRNLNRPNLAGAIVGKALYEGRVTLDELMGGKRC